MTLQETVEEASFHLDAVRDLFKPGVKVSLMVRVPEYPDRDFMLTDDTLTDLRAMIDRREAAEKKSP